MTRLRRPLRYETRIAVLSLLAGGPAVGAALWLVWSGAHPFRIRLSLTLLLPLAWLWATLALRDRVVRPLQTLSNLIGALREGDYSIRARGAAPDSPLGLALLEVNALADSMRRERQQATQATALLRRVMEEIDVAIFAFDDAGVLTLANRGAEHLLGMAEERALGLRLEALGLGPTLAGATPRLLDLALPGRSGRWELRRARYRWEGRPHTLVVLSDLSRSLREEERTAWHRLIRVISHEINNSLAPIRSIAGSLKTALTRRAEAAPDDLVEGLDVIENRAEALGRFIAAYARLARLPRPVLRAVAVEAWIRRVCALETRLAVRVIAGPGANVDADGDQLDALLINLVRNAADAALETGGGVEVGWTASGGWLEIRVADEGPGLPDRHNLFVPFFTTKPGGTGIGLALARQIAEGHGGTLTLDPRERGRGAVAAVRLPLDGNATAASPGAGGRS